jgi:hypothetical protein
MVREAARRVKPSAWKGKETTNYIDGLRKLKKNAGLVKARHQTRGHIR